MKTAKFACLCATLGLLLAAGAPLLASAGNTADATTPTFHKEVSRILQSECQVCHRPDGANLGGMVAPMALVTYEETRPWARAIAKAVMAKDMPPWDASPEHAGVFANERTLEQSEIDTLVAWAKAGAPAGDLADAPEPKSWKTDGGWLIGEPDLVLTVDEPFFVEDHVEDQYVYLTTTMTADKLPEDRWIKAVEFRPGSSVVHHIIMPGVGGIAPGNDPSVYRDGIGAVLKAGQDLQWQMHYHKEPGEGTGVWDKSQVAFKFYDSKDEVKHEIFNAGLGSFDWEIPPGAKDVSATSEYTFEHDSKIVGYTPHMHLRGTAAKYTAHYPDGTSEVILNVPEYDFNWQTNYEYADFKHVPAGTRVVFQSWWDNSAQNPHNPDPTVTVRWGEPTTDEMSFGFMSFINDVNEGPGAFSDDGNIDVTAIVAFTDKSRDGKMQLEEAPAQFKSYFAMIDTNKDGGVDMEEARNANSMLAKMRAAREEQAEDDTSGDDD